MSSGAVDLTGRQTSGEESSTHLVYWTAAKCARCGHTVRNRGRGLAGSRQSCPETEDGRRHNFAHGERGSLTTWSFEPEPTAEEVLELDHSQWETVLDFADY